jgi:hypothetical protein
LEYGLDCLRINPDTNIPYEVPVYTIGRHKLTPLQALSMDTYMRKHVSNHEPLINMYAYGRESRAHQETPAVSLFSLRRQSRVLEEPGVGLPKDATVSIPGSLSTPSHASRAPPAVDIPTGRDAPLPGGAPAVLLSGVHGSCAPPGSPLSCHSQPRSVNTVDEPPTLPRKGASAAPGGTNPKKRPRPARAGDLVDLEIKRCDKWGRVVTGEEDEEEEEEPSPLLAAEPPQQSTDFITNFLASLPRSK